MQFIAWFYHGVAVVFGLHQNFGFFTRFYYLTSISYSSVISWTSDARRTCVRSFRIFFTGLQVHRLTGSQVDRFTGSQDLLRLITWDIDFDDLIDAAEERYFCNYVVTSS